MSKKCKLDKEQIISLALLIAAVVVFALIMVLQTKTMSYKTDNRVVQIAVGASPRNEPILYVLYQDGKVMRKHKDNWLDEQVPQQERYDILKLLKAIRSLKQKLNQLKRRKRS